MAWADTEADFDSIEWSAMGWLRSEWQPYLLFHEANLGHLPENFEFDGTTTALEDDGRYRAMRRIGYLSYSVFVNVATARRAADAIPETFSDLLSVYDHISSVALRLGAAIDIAKLLERECCGMYDGRGGVQVRKNVPLHDALKKTLDDDDAYNNYLKHTGLPPVRIEAAAGLDVVLVPRKLRRDALNTANRSPWRVSNPDAPVSEQARDAVGRAVAAFCYLLRRAREVVVGATRSVEDRTEGSAPGRTTLRERGRVCCIRGSPARERLFLGIGARPKGTRVPRSRGVTRHVGDALRELPNAPL